MTTLVSKPTIDFNYSQNYSVQLTDPVSLKTFFCTTHGLPEVLVSESEPAFTREEFVRYNAYNGSHCITTELYHPVLITCSLEEMGMDL